MMRRAWARLVFRVNHWFIIGEPKHKMREYTVNGSTVPYLIMCNDCGDVYYLNADDLL